MIKTFALLHPDELKAFEPHLTVFLFPVGGLEQHGPHLPLGTKLIQAEGLSKALAEELEKRLPGWTFVLMPLIPLMVDGVTRHLALPVRPHVVRDAVVDQCEQLKRLGFKNFIAVNSHLAPRQITALEEAAKIVTGRSWYVGSKAQLISITSALVDSRHVFESPMIALPDEHGGAGDTSSMLYLARGSVKADYSSLESAIRPKPSVQRFLAYISNELDGYWGRPASASAENGQVELNSLVQLLSVKVIPWLEKGQGAGQFRSSYRHYPFNWSFAKAYFLAFLLFLMGFAWLFWSMQDVFQP
jgi:creatinine amidohydrolase